MKTKEERRRKWQSHARVTECALAADSRREHRHWVSACIKSFYYVLKTLITERQKRKRTPTWPWAVSAWWTWPCIGSPLSKWIVGNVFHNPSDLLKLREEEATSVSFRRGWSKLNVFIGSMIVTCRLSASASPAVAFILFSFFSSCGFPPSAPPTHPRPPPHCFLARVPSY